MTIDRSRRRILRSLAALPLLGSSLGFSAVSDPTPSALAQFAELEKPLNGRLGLFAWDTGTSRQLRYRADDAFPFCSTFKVLLVGAILQQDAEHPGLLQQSIRLRPTDFVTYSPITETHRDEDVTIAALCAAALQYSDNTAANILIKKLGGPEAVTAFARSLGDQHFRLDRWETDLNSAIPGDRRDTTTPAAMGQDLHHLLLGKALPAPQQTQLRQWLLGNTTGNKRIRAGVPSDWLVGDKTGTGSYGVTNDVAVLWPPQRAPIILAIYTTRTNKEAQPREDVIVSATEAVIAWLG
jgi:beta-lactamase class A